MNTENLRSSYQEQHLPRRRFLQLMAVTGVGLLGLSQSTDSELPSSQQLETPIADTVQSNSPSAEQNEIDTQNEEDVIDEELLSNIQLVVTTLAVGALVKWDKTESDESVGKSYLETFNLTHLELLGQLLLMYVMSKLTTAKIGNAGSNEMRKDMEENVLKEMFTATISAPLFEETLFRIIPSRILNATKQTGYQWKYGIPMATIFSLAHNIIPDENGQNSFNAEYLPLPQFLGGVFLWYINRKYGEGQGVASHMQFNSSALALSFFAKLKQKYS